MDDNAIRGFVTIPLEACCVGKLIYKMSVVWAVSPVNELYFNL